MNAAIYCRVSTDTQEIEGTSLTSQREACLVKAKELGYDIPPDNILLEVYSGLSMDRPKLAGLREWIRDGQIETVIAYTLDRVSRDPVHFIILQEEFEKAGVELVLVTETLDSSDMGKLISHIRGYAAKLEAQKILERTSRGRRERVKAGKLPTGRGILYGYAYDKEASINRANECLEVVRIAGEWIINEGVSLNEVCRRLMGQGIPAPKGGLQWSRGTIGRIFRNPTYAGKTFAYRTVTEGKRRSNTAPEKLVEIPNAVDRAAFSWDEWQMIQAQLERNRENSPRNQKTDYLLRGHVYCKQCGRKYYGYPQHGKPYYRCSGRIKLNNVGCTNKVPNAAQLEADVWAGIREALEKPEENILNEMRRQRDSGADIANLENQLVTLEKRQQSLDETDTRNIRLYTSGLWAYSKLERETLRLRNEQAGVEKTILDLKTRIDRAREWAGSEAGILEFCELLKKNLDSFDFEDKRLALTALNIRVYIDGENVSIDGIMPQFKANIVSQHSSWLRHNSTNGLHFSLVV